MKKDYRNIIIAALILFNIFTLSKINSIERNLDNNIQYFSSEQNNLRREMSNIYSNVDEKLKKQASILDSFDITFGDKLTEDLTVPVSISVTPKENTDNLTAELLINDVRNPMTKTGTSFIASVDAYIFNPIQIKVVLNNKKKKKIETIDKYDDLRYKYMLDINANFIGSVKYNSGKYEYDGDIVIHFFGPSESSLEKVSILRYLNGKILDEQEVDMHGSDSTMHSIKGDVELSANDRIEVYVNVQDNNGIIYKYIVKADEIDSEGKLVRMTPEWTNGSVIEIKDKNGKVLFENDYINN